MKRRVAFALGLILSAAWGNAHAQERVRVEILSKYPLTQIEIQGAESWKGEGTETGSAKEEGGNLSVGVSGSGLKIKAGERSMAAANLQIEGQGGLRLVAKGANPVIRDVVGLLKIFNRQGRLFFLLDVPLEEYVATVTAGEIPADAPMEAIKAQAVLVRTYVAANRGRHREDAYDFCDLTHCQVFGGRAGTDSTHRRAAAGTAGLILTYQGRAAEVLFHSTCGGHTSPNQKVFGGKALPYLQGVDDADYCRASPHASWTASLPMEEIQTALAADPEINLRGPLRELVPLDREAEGRWFSLELVGETRIPLRMETFLSRVGKALGWNRLKSAWFELQIKDGVAAFQGRGLGHGVGLCQEGAIGRARAGQDFRNILSAYFPGTRLERMR